ncbi:hypothetical protein PFISCL1PPCAC_20820, partial [Pristionchus fissidentatus]
ATLSSKDLKVFRVDLGTLKDELCYNIDMITPRDVINKIITAGDGLSMHDLWLFYENRVIFLIGRGGEYKKKPVKLPTTDWAGTASAVCFLTTRTENSSSTYLDLVFAAKNKGRIGVFAALQNEGMSVDRLHFDQWPAQNTSTAVALHAELIKCESQSGEAHDVTVRLFALKKSSESVHISIGRMRVDLDGFRVLK